MLGDVIFLRHHSNLSEKASDDDIRAHRVTYLALASFVVSYLDALLPPTHVSFSRKITFLTILLCVYCLLLFVTQAADVLTEDFSQVLALLAQDESLTQSFAHVRTAVLPYLRLVNPTAEAELLQAQTIANSMETCCSLLQDASDDEVHRHSNSTCDDVMIDVMVDVCCRDYLVTLSI